MIEIDEREAECADDNCVLYADDELLYAAAQQNNNINDANIINGRSGLTNRAATVPARALGAILRAHARGRNNSAAGTALEPLQRRFEIIARTNPGAVAVRFNGRRLTYGELDEQADELALHLQRDGLQPGSFCLLALAPSLAQVRVILAVLKAGAASLELDSALPPRRVASVLEVFRPSVRFVRDGDVAGPNSGAMRTVRCDEDAVPLPYGWPDEIPVGAGTAAHAFATVAGSGRLCISVRTHQALGSRVDLNRAVLPLAAEAPDHADFWRPLSTGALLTIAPSA